MTPFDLTPLAKRDLDDIWDYIAEDNVQAADRVLDALDNAMTKLAKTPGIGHWREDLTDKLHAARDLQNLLDLMSDPR